MANRWVKFQWPDRFKGDPRELGERAGLVVRPDGAGFKATTTDQYYKRSPRLVALDHVVLAQDEDRSRCRRMLEGWRGASEAGDDLPARVESEVRRFLHLDDGGTPGPEEYFEAARLMFLCLPDLELPGWVTDNLLPVLAASMPASRLCLISYSDEIHVRMAFIRALFAGDHAPEWFAAADGTEGFGAACGLGGEGFQGSSRLIDPLLGSHAPWMFATPLPRIRSGMAVALFGQILPGRRQLLDSDLIDTLTTHHLSADVPVRAPATPQVDAEQAEAAVKWWVNGLNLLMGHVLDLTLFTDTDGRYQAHQHHGYILSIERLFASVVSTLVHSGRDEYSRRMHLFESLDLLEGLSLGGYDQTAGPKRVEKYLAKLEEAVPDEAAPVVLPRCRATAQALLDFRETFHPGRLDNDGTVRVTLKNGNRGTVSKDKATVEYLRIMRNAGHSLREELEDIYSRSVLTSHEGNLAASASDLAFLHLLRLIADPALLTTPLLRPKKRAR